MYLLLKIGEWFSGHYREVSVGFMKWNVHFFSKKLGQRIEGGDSLTDWKQMAMKDFRFWLEDLPDDSPAGEDAMMDSCDLYTLLSEFSGLRQEIKLQNREQNKTLQTLGSFIGAYQETFDVFKEKTRDIEGLEERIRQSSEKRAVMPFLDVRDSLIRGQNACLYLAEAIRELSKSKGFFRSVPKGIDEIIEGIDGIVEGYEMAVRRFDSALELVDIRPVDAVGQAFDAKTMKAVGRRPVPDMEEGMVIEEHLSGFIREDEVVRTAEVVVAAAVVAKVAVNE
ncbi:MAG: nucleotide exchange factor GrpE [Deltaproteobacteria bacterium]|nr:MAG: nucleotide exchange factor GrpE [Deltaproteobacteria bacterium]